MPDLRFATLDPDEFTYGRVDRVSPTIRRVIAENPSKFTYQGTGTYLVGDGDVVVIDPGPVLDSHRDALAAALDGERVRAILVTHCHADHSPLAAWLAAETGAPTFAHGPHPRPDPDDVLDLDDPGDDPADDRADDRADAPESGDGEPEAVKVEETVDHDFAPDVAVRTGDVVSEAAGITFTALHTPGHTSNHTCWAFAEERALFTGDHVMGWSTTVVSPPDGDMAAYMASLDAVARRDDEVLWPTHGPPRRDGREYVRALYEHREARERQVLDAIASGRHTITEIVELLYADVRTELHEAAGRSVLAHLAKLVAEGRVAVADGDRARLRSRYEPA
ncbi:MAG: MBL fold metallo-hydrolase [Ilumatobacteraceae bacterium]